MTKEAQPTTEQEKWFAEARRLNKLVVELTPPRRTPGREHPEDTPLDVLRVLFAEQAKHLGGVAPPARGTLPGTHVPPHGRAYLRGGLDPWKVMQTHAVQHFKDHQDTEFPVVLENRAARRKWAKLNPFGTRKSPFRVRDVVIPEKPHAHR